MVPKQVTRICFILHKLNFMEGKASVDNCLLWEKWPEMAMFWDSWDSHRLDPDMIMMKGTHVLRIQTEIIYMMCLIFSPRFEDVNCQVLSGCQLKDEWIINSHQLNHTLLHIFLTKRPTMHSAQSELKSSPMDLSNLPRNIVHQRFCAYWWSECTFCWWKSIHSPQ